MKKIKLLFMVLFLLHCIPKIYAQQATMASGGNATGSGGSSSYSIGQVVYTTATGSGGTSSQGVQQAFEIYTLSGEEFTQIILQMVVYPNPTSSYVNLKIENYDFQDLSYQLFDLTGKQIYYQKITNSETQIELENLPKNVYLLQVADQNKTIKTFKIIKNN